MLLLIPEIRELGRTKQHLYGDKPGNQLAAPLLDRKENPQQLFLDFIGFEEKSNQWKSFAEVARGEADYFSCSTKHAQERGGR